MAGPAGLLAIVAGDGALPRRLAEARARAGLPYLVVSLPGTEAPWMAKHPHQHHRYERIGAFLAGLRQAGVSHLVLAGGITRPRLRPWAADWALLRRLPRILRLLRRGDDGLLRGLEAMLAEEGFAVIGPEEVLGGEALLGAGPLGRLVPGPADLVDAGRAARIVEALGPLDVGQGAVVARGLCLAIETIEGTDLMLARVAALPAERRRAAPAPSGVLWKAPKPGQDRRLDRPAIGPATVEGAVAAGLAGICVAADEVLCPERDDLRRAADAAGIFVYGVRPEELP